MISKRYRSSIRATVRQGYAYGKSHTRLYKRFAARGMPRPEAGAARRAWWQLVVHARGALSSRQALGAWFGDLARRWGRLVGSLRHRTRYL